MISFSFYENPVWRALSAYEKLVHHYLANRAYKDGQTRVNIETIAGDLNIDRKTVMSATTRLHKQKFIVKAGKTRKTIYILNGELVPPGGSNQLVPPEGTNTAISTVSGIGLVPPDGTRSKRSKRKNPVPFPESSFEYRLAVKLWQSILESGTSQKEPNLQSWAKVFDLMHRADKRPYHFILLTMTKAREDDFWRQNLRSPETLRRQLNAGKLDRFTPAEGEYSADEQLIESEKGKAA